MTPSAKRWINEECGSLMMELGYIESMNWKFVDVSKKGNQQQQQPQRRAA